MKLRHMQEEMEQLTLSPFAQKSTESRGRAREEAPCDLRPVFQRDRDRILHSKSFRRMKHKTQVFISPEGDHYRTRLTHTLEVAQIARTIARMLCLNEGLTEAIALGHDLGHTPFGHAGERSLDRLCKAHGGFAHNEQSKRVVELIEKDGEGLNLTWEVCDGILNHRTVADPQTLEGKIVQLADKIAYTNHDIDDAVRAEMLLPSDIPSEIIALVGNTSSTRINAMIHDTVFESLDQNDVRMSQAMYDCLSDLRAFMFKRVYMSEIAEMEHLKAERIVEALYHHFMQHPEQMEGEFLKLLNMGEPVWRVACDYIACMTDRYAVSKYTELFVPKGWHKV